MADNYLVKDGANGNLTKASKDLGSGVQADKQMAVDSAGGEILGTLTTARSTATDGTSTPAMAVWKQISFSIQALVTAFGNAWTRGAGAVDGNTVRVTVASGDQTAPVADNADAVAASGSLLNIPVVAKLMAWSGSAYDRLQLDASKFLKVASLPSATDGLSVFRSLDMDETEEDVKTSPGCLYKLRITNRTNSVRYVKLYNNTAANVTVGTTTPIDTIPVPANANDMTVLTESFGGVGLAFSTALSIAATTGFADNDTGAPGTNDVIVSAYYK